MISRKLLKLINPRMDDSKVIIILGPRQSGKTTLLQEIVRDSDKNVLWLNGDESDVRQLLSNQTSTALKSLIGNHNCLVIDEGQRIENIGLCIKLIHDNIKGVKVVASGPSAFELANKINEPLTGRKWEFFLYPLSYSEMSDHQGRMNERRLLEHRLIYGYYPEVVTSPGNEKMILQQISDSYLYKDLLTWENIKKPDRLELLVQALAFQIGSQVSYHELAQTTGLDKETVERYMLLLERAFIIFRLPSFNRNLRNELKKSRKIYFFDNGLRNAIVRNFNPLGIRNDVGQLWENFIISERVKHMQDKGILANQFFWRTHSQQEIDYIEEREGMLYAYEMKWKAKKHYRFPAAFRKAYPNSESSIITPENFEEFVG